MLGIDKELEGVEKLIVHAEFWEKLGIDVKKLNMDDSVLLICRVEKCINAVLKNEIRK